MQNSFQSMIKSLSDKIDKPNASPEVVGLLKNDIKEKDPIHKKNKEIVRKNKIIEKSKIIIEKQNSIIQQDEIVKEIGKKTSRCFTRT